MLTDATSRGSLTGELIPFLARQVAALLLLATLLLVAPCVWAQQIVRVAVYENPPKVSFQRTGKPEGLFIDIIEYVASQEHWAIEYVTDTRAEGLARLASGEADLMADLRPSAKREKVLSFHQEPVLNTWNKVFAHADSQIHDILDLSGKRVAVMDGSVQHDFAQMAEGFGVRPTVVTFPTFASAFEAVAKGQADAVLATPLHRHLKAQYGLAETAVMFNPSGLYFAASKTGRPEFLAAIDRHLKDLKADPTSMYFTSMRKWTTFPEDPALPPWVKWAVAACGALLLIGAAWAFTLHRASKRLAVSERAQRHLAEELTRISDHSLDVIAVLDKEFNITRISRATQALWGYSPMDLEGRSCLPLFPEAEQEAAMEMLEQVRNGRSFHTLQGRIRRKDGTSAVMLWSLVQCKHQQELYAIGRDDTERHELISRLRARGAQLQVANEDLRTFAQSVSHDLRSPVAAVVGFVGKVLLDEGATMRDRSRELLTRAHAASQRIDTIIANLLRLARLTEQGIHRRECDITVMCQDVVTTLRNEDARDVTVDIQLGMRAVADRQLLRHVFDNLLSNAWKFSAGKPQPCIAVGCEGDPADPVFFVRDNGAGFDMAYAQNLFKPFARLHDEVEFDGTGIGLSIAHRVVTGHGGRIWAEAAPGEGAVFRFTLGDPALQPPQVTPVPDLESSILRSVFPFGAPRADQTQGAPLPV